MCTLSILEQLCFSTTRIETEDSVGGKFSGTGFFYNLIIGDKTIPLIVTNKHVVQNMKKELHKTMTQDQLKQMHEKLMKDKQERQKQEQQAKLQANRKFLRTQWNG